MRNMNRGVLVLVILLTLSTLACSFSLELPWDIGAPDVAISPEQVSAAATRAAALADQAGQIAATAVVQGDQALATAAAQTAPAAPASLQDKLAAVQPDAMGVYTIPITDLDLAQLLATQGGGFSYGDTRIENLRIQTRPDAVVLNGDLTSPLAVALTARFLPVVEDGRLRFQALDANAGVLPVPSSMLSLLETGVNLGLNQALATLPAGLRIEEVLLGEGVLTIRAR